MERKFVKSTNIKSIGYDESTSVLEVEFNNGSIYQYSPLLNSGYQSLMSAKSKGVFFNENIKNNETIRVTKIK